jgi:hypothetical protein
MHDTCIKIIHQLCLTVIRSFVIAINKQDDKHKKEDIKLIWWMRTRGNKKEELGSAVLEQE